MLNKTTIIDTLRKNRSILQKDFHILRMGLFGSFSTGAQTPESDIDFIIELDKHTDDIFTTKKALRSYLQGLFGRKVDLAHYKYLKSYARQHILDEVESIV